MKKVFSYLFVALFLLGGVSFAKAQDTEVDPGVTAESSLFFVDRLGEALRQIFTFDNDAKARLRVDIAEERIAELRVLLQSENRNQTAVERTQRLVDRTLTRVPEHVRAAISQGREIENLETRLIEVEDRARSLPDDSVSGEVEDSVSDIRTRIRIASEETDSDEAEDALDAIFDAARERIKARERIARQQVGENDVTVALALYRSGDQALFDAQEAYNAGNFEKAEILAENARRYFNQAREGGNFNDDDLDKDSDDDSDDSSSSNGNSVVICHYPQSSSEGSRPLTISVSEQAWNNAHKNHEGDHLGVCDLSQTNNSDNSNDDSDDDSDDNNDDSSDDSDDGQMEIEADVFLDTTIVKVEINDVKTYFETSANTRATIIAVVAEEFNLSEDDVQDVIEIDFEDRESRPSDMGDDNDGDDEEDDDSLDDDDEEDDGDDDSDEDSDDDDEEDDD